MTLGLQTSQDDIPISEYVLELRELLAKHCGGPYCDEIKEFALILRVGGALQEFEFEGCERIRQNRREQYITVDLGVPSYRWKSLSRQELREYLVETVKTGLLCCLERLARDKIQVNSGRLISDLIVVQDSYLKAPPDTLVRE